MSPISGWAKRRRPPRAAARPISSAPKLAAKSRNCVSFRRWSRNTSTAYRSIACQIASTVDRSTLLPRSMPPISAAKCGLTWQISMAMEHPPSVRVKIRRPSAPVNCPKLVPACHNCAHGRGELGGEIRQRQREELFVEPKCHDAVDGREHGTGKDSLGIPVELGEERA